MTDSNLTPPTEDESISPEDAALAEEFDIRSLDIDLSNTPIIDLLRIYREQAEICNEYAKLIKSGSSDPTDVTSIIKAKVKATLSATDKTVGDEVKNRRCFDVQVAF